MKLNAIYVFHFLSSDSVIRSMNIQQSNYLFNQNEKNGTNHIKYHKVRPVSIGFYKHSYFCVPFLANPNLLANLTHPRYNVLRIELIIIITINP